MNAFVRRTICLFALAEFLLACRLLQWGGRMRQTTAFPCRPAAIDCGDCLFPSLVAKNNACAIGATVEHAPFYIRWEIHDHAPRTMRGIAMTHTGQIFLVTETLGTPAGELEMTPCDAPNLVPDPSVTSVKALTCGP